jgi:3-oxoacyl-[acyl-carrier-protein] synthase II
MRRVVITGMGAVTPIALDLKSYWDRLLSGKSGVGFIEQMDTKEFKVKIGGEIKNFDAGKYFDSRAARRMDRFSQFAMVAGLEAAASAGSTNTKTSIPNS